MILGCYHFEFDHFVNILDCQRKENTCHYCVGASITDYEQQALSRRMTLLTNIPNGRGTLDPTIFPLGRNLGYYFASFLPNHRLQV